MNQIENIVTDLETSKQLQVAGIKYETAFVWVRYATSPSVFGVISRKDFEADKSLYDKVINAFTAGEMMQVLPDTVCEESFCLSIEKCGNHYFANYKSDAKLKYLIEQNGYATPEQSLAELCLWCRKEGYL